jgi:hypothetical protein
MCTSNKSLKSNSAKNGGRSLESIYKQINRSFVFGHSHLSSMKDYDKDCEVRRNPNASKGNKDNISICDFWLFLCGNFFTSPVFFNP